MEITKIEIEGITERRFVKEHWRLFSGVVIGFLALLIGLSIGLHPESVWLEFAIAIPILIGVLIFIGFWQKASNRYTKSLMTELEKNPTLTYVPEPKEHAEIAKT